jgi:hypothetical protein
MHVHYLQDEAFTFLQGRIGYPIAGQEPVFAGAGEAELRCTAYIAPAGNAEYFLAALFASQKANGGRRPTLLDLAFLTRRYRSEYGMVDIPGIVQRLVFPVLVAIGRALGQFEKYADAPQPMKR